jgi:NAD+ kinase
VIATPTGSTAYSYAAGGPVVSPALDAVIVSVAATSSGVARPVVVSAAEPLELGLLDESGRPALEADGILVRRAEPGETLDVRCAREPARWCDSTPSATSAASR